MNNSPNNEPASQAGNMESMLLFDVKKDIERSKNRSFYGMLVAICIAIAGILGFAYMSIATVNDAEKSVQDANEVSVRLGEVTARLEDTKRLSDTYKAELKLLADNGANSAEMGRLKQNLASLGGEYAQLEQTEAALRKEKTRLETQVQIAQTDVLAALDKNEDLKTVIKQSSRSLSQARREQSAAEDNLVSARKAQQSSRAALQRAKDSNRSIQSQLTATKRLQQETQTTLNSVRRSITVSQPTYPDLRGQLARVTRLQRQTRSALDRANRQLANSSGSNATLNRLRAQLAARERTIATQKRTIRTLNRNVAGLKAKLRQCSGAGSAQLNRKLRTCRALVRSLRQRVVD